MTATRIHAMSDKLLVRLAPDLKGLVEQEANRLSLEGGMGEFVVKLLAEHFQRPDLSKVPRKRMGRPPGPAKKNVVQGNGKRSKVAS